jgi:hypothetical protein
MIAYIEMFSGSQLFLSRINVTNIFFMGHSVPIFQSLAGSSKEPKWLFTIIRKQGGISTGNFGDRMSRRTCTSISPVPTRLQFSVYGKTCGSQGIPRLPETSGYGIWFVVSKDFDSVSRNNMH